MEALVQFWVGVDVSKLKLDVAVLDARGKFKQKVFANDTQGHGQLRDWLMQRGAAPCRAGFAWRPLVPTARPAPPR